MKMFVYIVYESMGYGAGADVHKVFREETAAQLYVLEMNEAHPSFGPDDDPMYSYEQHEVY